MLNRLFFSCLFCITFFFQQCIFAQVERDLVSRFRTAKTVSLSIDEAYKNAPEMTLFQDYEYLVRHLVSYTGLRLVKQSEDPRQLRIFAQIQGVPISKSYGGGGSLYLGSVLSGSIQFSMPGTDSYSVSFRSVDNPPDVFYAPEKYIEIHKSEKNTPYRDNINNANSFGPALAGILSQVFGAGFIMKALQDPQVEIQHAAAIHSACAGPGLLDPLISLLGSGQMSVRKSAVEALGYMNDPGAVDPLILALKDDHEWVRRHALLALGRTREERVYGLLVDSLMNHSFYAIEALELFNDLRSVELLLDFKGKIRSNDPKGEYAFRIQKAVDSLAARHSLEEVFSLYKGSGTDVRSRLIQHIVHKISRGEKPDDTAPLVAGLGSEDRNLRIGSNSCFSYMVDESAIHGLIANLCENDQPLYSTAQYALIHQGEAAVGPLIVFLDDESCGLREKRRVVETLTQINDPRAIEPMVEILKKNDGAPYSPNEWRVFKDFVRKQLEEFRHEVCVEPLIDSFSENGYLNNDIARLIKNIGDEAIPGLIKALDQPDQYIVNEACKLLGSMKAKEAVDPLIGLLSEEAPPSSAIYALGHLKDVRAVRPLMEFYEKNKKNTKIYGHSLDQTLNELTGNHFYGYKAWKKWWKENKTRYL